MKLLAFAASNSKKSINRKLVKHAAGMINGFDVEILDIHDYEMPIFSADREEEHGIPSLAHDFFAKIGGADALLISYAEHNGSYTAAYKNLYDWASRIEAKVFQGKPMVLLSTSPGPGGASSVLATASTSAPYFGGEVKASLSVPRFYDNFDLAAGKISNPDIQKQLEATMGSLGEYAGS